MQSESIPAPPWRDGSSALHEIRRAATGRSSRDARSRLRESAFFAGSTVANDSPRLPCQLFFHSARIRISERVGPVLQCRG